MYRTDRFLARLFKTNKKISKLDIKSCQKKRNYQTSTELCRDVINNAVFVKETKISGKKRRAQEND